ncbi:MAG: hypothetical protein ACRDKJ_05245 [Actinomycetota bacterium]
MSARLETLGRGFFVIGVLAGVGALAVIFGREILKDPPEPPPTQALSAVLTRADVVFDGVREDLSETGGRTVLLSVPEATDQDAAVRGVLLLLRNGGWRVSGRGGAISRDGSVCLAVTTPSLWLNDRANDELHDEVDDAESKTTTPTVVVDMFFCSDAERE